MPNDPTETALLDARPADHDPAAASPPAPVAGSRAKELADELADMVEAQKFERQVQFRLRQLKANQEADRRLEAEEHPPVPLPPFETLRARLARQRAPTTQRIKGWLPVNARVILAAQAKTGKSTATLNLSRSLLDGDPWLGVAPVTPIDGALVVIDAEMSEGQLEDWYRAQGIRADDRLVLQSLRGRLSAFNILDRTARAEWAARLKELKAGYLILDCLRPFLDALGLDEQHQAGRFLVAFDALLAEAGIAEAAMVHHFGHDGARARGDSRLRDWPDCEWRLLRASDNPSSVRSLAAYGRDVDQPKHALLYDQASRRLTLAAGAAAPQSQNLGVEQVEQALTAIQALLADQPGPMSGRKVEEAMVAQGIHGRARVRKALTAGVDRGLILCQDAAGPGQPNLYSLPTAMAQAV